MKTKNIIANTAFLFLGVVTLFTSSCSKQKNLSSEEIADLKFLREEEKLARDIYLHAFDIYGEPLFKNISSSEQSHMDKMLDLLHAYEIPDPASKERGVFNNLELQNLYNSLIIKSDSSLLDAYIVGATIEDLDLYDIDEFIERTEKLNILDTYDLLECGSKNHMRAFYNALFALGYSYTPQFITSNDFNNIIGGEHENCSN